jgi:hypothetical protein
MWFQKKKKSWLTSEGLAPAVGIVGYVGAFTLLVTQMGRLFPQDPPFAPLMVLTLFCFSALSCSLIVFYKPYLLLVDKKGKEAMSLVVATTKWLGILAVLIVLGMVVVSSR